MGSKINVVPKYDDVITYTYNEKEEKVSYVKKLNCLDFGSAIEVAMDAIYHGGTYKPYIKEYAIAATIVQFYTDYSGSYEPVAFMEFLENSDLYVILKRKIGDKQLFKFEDMVEEMIAYRNSSAAIGKFFTDMGNAIEEIKEKVIESLTPEYIERIRESVLEEDKKENTSN